MRKYQTVKSKQDFNNIIHHGQFIKNKYYIIYSLPNNKTYQRYGIAVSTKLGHAVIRNKLKRQLRVIIQNNKNLFPITKDYIIMIRNTCLDLTFSEMNNEFINLMKEQ